MAGATRPPAALSAWQRMSAEGQAGPVTWAVIWARRLMWCAGCCQEQTAMVITGTAKGAAACLSAASPRDIFGVAEPAVRRDAGVMPPAVAGVREKSQLKKVHRETVCFRPLIERPLRPLLAGRVHHVVPHLDDASQAIAACLVWLPDSIELLGHCRQVGEGAGHRSVDAAVAEPQQRPDL